MLRFNFFTKACKSIRNPSSFAHQAPKLYSIYDKNSIFISSNVIEKSKLSSSSGFSSTSECYSSELSLAPGFEGGFSRKIPSFLSDENEWIPHSQAFIPGERESEDHSDGYPSFVKSENQDRVLESDSFEESQSHENLLNSLPSAEINETKGLDQMSAIASDKINVSNQKSFLSCNEAENSIQKLASCCSIDIDDECPNQILSSDKNNNSTQNSNFIPLVKSKTCDQSPPFTSSFINESPFPKIPSIPYVQDEYLSQGTFSSRFNGNPDIDFPPIPFDESECLSHGLSFDSGFNRALEDKLQSNQYDESKIMDQIKRTIPSVEDDSLLSELVSLPSSASKPAGSDTSDESTQTMSGFALQFLELSKTGVKVYSEIAPSPSACASIPRTKRLQTFFKYKQWSESNDPSVEQNVDSDALLSETIALHACRTDKELLAKLTEFFNREGGTPPNRLLVEAIKCLGKLGDSLGCYAVIEQVKRRGMLSYLDACTPQVFAALIESTWDSTRDPYRLCQILEEMRRNGIQPDQDIEFLVQKAIKYLHDRHLTTLRDQISRLFHKLQIESFALDLDSK